MTVSFSECVPAIRSPGIAFVPRHGPERTRQERRSYRRYCKPRVWEAERRDYVPLAWAIWRAKWLSRRPLPRLQCETMSGKVTDWSRHALKTWRRI